MLRCLGGYWVYYVIVLERSIHNVCHASAEGAAD
jgi:hypothetical protein